MRSAFALLVLASVGACTADLPFGGALITCESNAECPTGSVCVSSYCAPADSPCISGSGTTALDDGTTCTVGSTTGACHSGQCAICGDRVTEPGESCDDGNDNNTTDSCTQKCQPPQCGDGYLQAGEQCDDGNTSAGDGCLPNCVLNTCGDKSVDPATETCDDGNNDNANDGCNACQLNQWAPSIIVGYGLDRAANNYSFFDIENMVADGGQGIYVLDRGVTTLWRYDRTASRLTPVTRNDGKGGPLVIPEGAIATQTGLGILNGLAIDTNGDIYIGVSLGTPIPYSAFQDIDPDGDLPVEGLGITTVPVVLRIDTNGQLHNVAGNGQICADTSDACGNGILGLDAQLYQVTALAFDQNGDLLIGDYYTLWRLDHVTGILTRVLGSFYDFPDDGCTTPACNATGPAVDALVTRIGGIAVDSAGGIMVSDGYKGRLLRVDPDTKAVSLLPSTGLKFPKV